MENNNMPREVTKTRTLGSRNNKRPVEALSLPTFAQVFLPYVPCKLSLQPKAPAVSVRYCVTFAVLVLRIAFSLTHYEECLIR